MFGILSAYQDPYPHFELMWATEIDREIDDKLLCLYKKVLAS